MKTEVKLMDEELFEVVCGWWKKHSWPVMPRDFLPKRAYVSFVDDVPTWAGFLYKDEGSCHGMFEWAVANPDIFGEVRGVGFTALISWVCEEAERCGIKYLMSTTSSGGLEKRLEREGFFVTDRNVQWMVRVV
jgi:hypothetical protein